MNENFRDDNASRVLTAFIIRQSTVDIPDVCNVGVMSRTSRKKNVGPRRRFAIGGPNPVRGRSGSQPRSLR
jgi:hypothetical protein